MRIMRSMPSLRSSVRRFVVLGLLFIAVAPIEAQGRPARQVARERVMVRRAVVRERIQNMTPVQRQQLKASRQALRVERQRIAKQLRNGSITREQGRQSMRSWRLANRPNVGLRGPRRPGGGEF